MWSSMAPLSAGILTQCPQSQAGGQRQQAKLPWHVCVTLYMCECDNVYDSACVWVCTHVSVADMGCPGMLRVQDLCCQCSWKAIPESSGAWSVLCGNGRSLCYCGVSPEITSPVSGFRSCAFPSPTAGCCGHGCPMPARVHRTGLGHHHPDTAIPRAPHGAVSREQREQIPQCMPSTGCPLVPSRRRFWPSPGCSHPHSCSQRLPGGPG